MGVDVAVEGGVAIALLRMGGALKDMDLVASVLPSILSLDIGRGVDSATVSDSRGLAGSGETTGSGVGLVKLVDIGGVGNCECIVGVLLKAIGGAGLIIFAGWDGGYTIDAGVLTELATPPPTLKESVGDNGTVDIDGGAGEYGEGGGIDELLWLLGVDSVDPGVLVIGGGAMSELILFS